MEANIFKPEHEAVSQNIVTVMRRHKHEMHLRQASMALGFNECENNSLTTLSHFGQSISNEQVNLSVERISIFDRKSSS